MRELRSVDAGAYFRAIPLYLRNPQIALAPFVTALIGTLILMVLSPGSGSFGALGGGIGSLIVSLLDGFGLGVAVIMGDAAWRHGRSSFESAWEEGRRKLGDILFAALGYNFVLWIAGIVGGLLGQVAGLALTAVAAYFFIYAIPAAAIGGIPGGAALSVSLERVKRSYLNTLLLVIAYVVVYALVPTFWGVVATPLVQNVTFINPSILSEIVLTVVKGICAGYVALVMAKAYSNVSFGRFW